MFSRLKNPFSGGIPLYILFAGVMTGCMLAFFLFTLVGGWLEYRILTRSMADQTFSSAAGSVRGMLENRLRPLLALVNTGAELETGKGSFTEETQLLVPFFIRSLDANTPVLAISYYAENGDFFAVVATHNERIRRYYEAPENTAYVLWRIEDMPDGHKKDTREFRTPTYELLESRTAETAYDPHASQWYRESIDAAGTRIITVLHQLSLSGEMGITCAKSSKRHGSVFAIHVLLDDFTLNLLPVPISSNAVLLLLNSEHRLLAQSGGTTQWNKNLSVRSLNEHPDPAVRAAAQHIRKHPPEHSAHRIAENGYFLACTNLAFGENNLDLVITAPVDDFKSIASSFFTFSAILVTCLFLVFLPVALFCAWRVSRALVWLAEDLEQGRDLPAKGAGYTNSLILEIRRLADAIRKVLHQFQERTSLLITLQDQMRSEDSSIQDASNFCLIEKENRASDIAPILQNRNESAISPGGILAGTRVLVAADDAVTMQALSDMLHNWEIRVDTAVDGLEAAEKAWVGKYDLLVLDESLIGIPGITLAKMLRQSDRLRGTPILIVGEGNPETETISDSLQTGIQERLRKPVRPDILHVALQHWFLAASAARQEKF